MVERNLHAVLSHVSGRMWGAYGALAIIIAVCFGLDIGDQTLYEMYKPVIWGTIAIFFVGITGMAIHRCACHGHRSIGQVSFFSILLLCVTLAMFYIIYFQVTGSLVRVAEGGATTPTERILNVPPVVAAIWAAGIGWYIHFQATAKGHRTNNALNLLMQTRTSKEFLQRSEAVQRVYPHGSSVPVEAVAEATFATLRNIEDKLQSTTLNDDERSELRTQSARIEAVLALKYMLNYYEFMAVGLEKNDLDDGLLYDTIGTHVPSIYRRAENLVKAMRGPGTDILAFSALEPLVVRWEDKAIAEARALEDRLRA